MKTLPKIFLLMIITLFIFPCSGGAQNIIELSLDRAVEIAMENSYRIKQLKLGIERSRLWLKAERAGLKSKVYMNLTAPEFEAISDYKWNSVENKDVIVRQNTQMWQANLSIRQPVILFGYPTNGYFSLNNRAYRYDQIDGFRDINYYNRLFLKYEQPFFRPNRLKNDIEEAELSLERRELQYVDDQVDLIDDIADDYYDLYRYSFYNSIYKNQVENLERVTEIADCQSIDGDESMDCIQIRVELTNAREKIAQNKSNMRLESMRFKQRLRLDPNDSLIVKPTIKIPQIQVDLEQAINYGLELRPRMRLLEISEREREIDLVNVKGWNSFRMNLEMTYGLEKQDPSYEKLWTDNYDKSYSVALTAYMPLWDWGQRQARIEAQKITIEKTRLYMEETRNRIRSEIENAVQNLEEYQRRATNMKENMEMSKRITEMSLEQYKQGEISLQDLLQNITRQRETENNFLEAYLGYRQSLLNLMVDTYYDYEQDIKLLEKYRNNSSSDVTWKN